MASENIDINVNANTANAQRNLETLKSKVEGLSATFGKLTQALAAFGALNVVSNVINYADAINDLSEATGVAIQNIVGFQKAVQMAGGDTEKAQTGLLKFVTTIGEAANGSAGAQNAFAAVGVTLKDLATLSEQDLLAKVVTGLGNITDKAEQARLKTELFGKALRGVSAEQLAEAYGKASAESAKYAESIRKAAEVQDTLDKTLSVLKNELLVAIQPISELAKAINENIEALRKWIAIIIEIGTYVAIFFAVTKAIQLVVGAIRLLAAAPALISAGWATLKRTFDIFVWQLGKIKDAGGIVGETFTALGKRLQFLGIGLNDIAKGFGVLAAAAYAAYKAVKEFFFGGGDEEKKQAADNQAEIQRFKNRAEAAKQTAVAIRDVEDAQKKLRTELANVTRGFALQNDQIITNINRESEYVKIGEQAAEVLKAQREIQDRAASTIRELQDRKAGLKSEEKALIPVIDAQIAKIRQQSIVDQERVKTAVEGLQTQRLLEEERIKQLERIQQQIENQKKLEESLLKIRQSTQGQLDTAQFEGAQMGRSPLERQFASIQENARKAALEASRAFAEQFDDMDLTAEQAKQLADGLKLIEERYTEIAAAQSRNLEQSRTWAQGWKDAFNEYMDNATNAARKAGDVFSSITRNMESAIDRFVETGKFSFKDFATSIIQDMLKIELKAAASKILSGIFGAGGVGSFFGSLFGFANGGQPPVGKPSIVGERGPELFIPKTPGTIVPNEMLGGKNVSAPVTNNYYTYNIDAIDSRSVAQFFAENRKTMLGTIQLAQKELPYFNK